MARIPTDPTPDPNIGTPAAVTEPPAQLPPNFDGPAYANGQAGANVALSEDQLRAAADSLGLNFDGMNAEEHEFVAMFARGALDSVAPAVEADINNDPIVLPDGTAVPPVTADAPTPAATQEPGADGAGVGSASDEPDDGSGQAQPTAPVTSPETSVAGGAPGAPAFDIPSPLPPAAPAPAPEPAPQQQPEPLVMLPNGQMVPLSYAQGLLAAQQQQPPPAYPQPQPTPTFQQPPQQYPTPFGTEYVDERAGAEIARLAAQQQQTQQLLGQMQEQAAFEQQRQQQIHAQAIDQAIRETTSGYGNARGLTPQEAEALLTTATQMGALGMYSQMYPGDPRRAVGAALEMTYWITPEMRQREVDKQLEQGRAQVAEIERQKALAGSTASSPGSVPRNPAPARTRAEADQGIVAMIEADLARQNGGAGPR